MLRRVALILLALLLMPTAWSQQVPAPTAAENVSPEATSGDAQADPGLTAAPAAKVRSEGAADAMMYAPPSTERLRIDSDNGNVRIGPAGSTPEYLLHVKQDADANIAAQVENLNAGVNAASLMRVKTDTAAANLNAHGSGRTVSRFGQVLGGWSEILQWQGNGLIVGTLGAVPLILGTNNTNRLYIAADGKIGIGTPNGPTAQLHVYGGETTDTFSAYGVDAANGPALTIGYSGNSFGRSSAFLNVRPDALAVAPNPSFRFFTANVQRMIITNTGAVGINTIPAAASPYIFDVNGAAHVSGNMVVDGNLAAKYQDVAEWVPSASDLLPGTVVVLDPSVGNGVMTSSKPYDTTVAGVVSTKPGIILGEGGAQKEQIATTGRVRVRADATAAPIHVGDLLVTSGEPGYAMKSQPIELAGISIHRPGTIVGKALESLLSGKGEILVLLTLQ